MLMQPIKILIRLRYPIKSLTNTGTVYESRKKMKKKRKPNKREQATHPEQARFVAVEDDGVRGYPHDGPEEGSGHVHELFCGHG